jgi:2-oxoglutarate dehydrogenase E2 component (dihydrolipoamide succinyltransferase)
MIVEIRVPDFGEVNGMTIARWVKETGDVVEKDEVIAEVDSDKACITINSPEAGRIEILVDNVDVESGQLIARLDTYFKPDKKIPNSTPDNYIVGR